MRIAVIKSSSMGDVIHALPVVSDLIAAVPGIVIDWVVEESFADLPRLHPAVDQVVPVAVRRWRKTPFSPGVRAEISAVRRRLHARRYDLALDLQGLIKSAWLARLTGAPVAGFGWSSAREPLASLVYRRSFKVPADLHAIERLRLLSAQVFGYEVLGLPRFNLQVDTPALPWVPAAPYVVFLHATSRAEKQWPAEHWVMLAKALVAVGVEVVLPWGGRSELLQAEAIASAVSPLAPEGATCLPGAAGAAVQVAPSLTLAECAALLRGALGVVGVDTGLTHLAAALGRPTVALFAATAGWRFGPYWSEQATSLGEPGIWPEPPEVLRVLGGLAGLPDT